jgi:hypothetical protein
MKLIASVHILLQKVSTQLEKVFHSTALLAIYFLGIGLSAFFSYVVQQPLLQRGYRLSTWKKISSISTNTIEKMY